MALSREEIKKVAELARLELEEAEIKEYQSQLENVLDYIDILQTAETDDQAVLSVAEDELSQGREDRADIWPDDEKKIALDQMLGFEGDQVKVNRVL